MIHCRETNLSTQRQEEWNLVGKKDVSCQEDLFRQFQQLHRYFHIVLCHRIRFLPGGLPFQRRDVLAPNLGGNIDVFNRNRTVLDLIATNNPLEVLHRRVIERSVHSSCDLCTLDLPLGKTFLVLGDSLNESKQDGCSAEDRNSADRSGASEIPYSVCCPTLCGPGTSDRHYHM